MKTDPNSPHSETEARWHDVVGWTAPLTFQLLAPLKFVPEARPAEFRSRVFGEGPKMTKVESEGWVEEHGRLNAKFSRIQSAIADIATIMIYPTASPEILPIFAAEWVVIGEKCHALILDVETAGNQPNLRSKMEETYLHLGEKWRKIIPENRDRPEWFNEIATPWAVYGSAPLKILPDVEKAFSEYLQSTVRDYYLPYLDTAAAGPDHPDVKAYKQHHFENSPGRPLLKAKAGASWTDDFLANWHFGPAHPKSSG